MARELALTVLSVLALSAICIESAVAQPVQAAGARIKVKVSPGQAAMFSAQTSRLIADYGSFQLWDIPAALREDVKRAGGEVREQEDVIQLNAKPIRTALGMAQAKAFTTTAFTGKRLYLVQFAGPVKPEWRQELVGQGWQIVSHVSRNAYLVYGSANSLTRLRSAIPTATHIQWEGEYKGEHKIHPIAQSSVQKASAGQETEDMFAIQLIEDPEANAATLQLLDSHKLEPIKQSRNLGYVNCILRLPPGQLASVAERPDVVSIQPYRTPQLRDERQAQILAGNLTGGVPTGPGYLAWLGSKGLSQAQFTASGFVVDVTDSGIDNGTQTPGHFGLYTLGNKAQASRVAYNRILPLNFSGGTLEGCDGHGNIDAHIIAGYNDLTGFPHADPAGYHYGLGICPLVRVGSSVIFAPSYTFPDFNELQSRAYQNGARISCNSWGANVFGAYTIDCQMYDALVRDAQPAGSPFPTAGNQEMVIVFAAGNAGVSGSSTIGSPGSAKNILCVGAAENVHSHSDANGGNDPSGNDGCGVDDTGADNANDIISFSSRGPCQDGRIKPDLVGPGTHVTGGVGQTPWWNPLGSALPCFDASVVCALPGGGFVGSPDNFFPLGQQFYTTSSGTSHSCPAIGGGAALLRQFFINHGWTAPSPAMTKAWLMNSARYMTGVDANDTLPSNNQGMGSMNLGMAFDGVPRVARDQIAADRFTATGQYRTYQGTIANSTRPFRVTLAWTDAPGQTFGNAYNNNLNLMVTVGGFVYYGNGFNGASSIPVGPIDDMNNVESVFIPAGVSGPFTVTVIADDINSDGVPNNADALDQDFALVVYNGALSGSPPPGPPTPTGVAATPIGSATIRLTWNPSSGATGYRIKRSNVSGGPYFTVATKTSTLHVDTPLANGSTYYYVVSAINAVGESANSSQVSATTPQLLAPTGITATSCSGQVTLNWNATFGATGYRVKRSTSSGGPYTVIVSQTAKPYVDLNVVNGTTYYYVVSAINNGGESANSAQISTTPHATIPTITSFAGNGTAGYTGDGGLAANATLSSPHGIFFNNYGGGRFVIADMYNAAIRYIGPNGYIYTLNYTGGSYISPAGAAMDSNGYLYVADADWSTIREFQGGNDPIHLDMSMYLGCTLDGSGNLYGIPGYENVVNKLHCVIPYGGSPDGVVTKVAGSTSAGYWGDGGLAVDAGLNVNAYFFQAGHVVVASLTVDNQGNVYIADIGNNVIRKVDTSGIINTVAGNFGLGGGFSGDGGQATDAQLLHPAGVAVRGNFLYISDTGNNRIRQVDLITGIITTVAGTGVAGYSGNGGPATSAKLNTPGPMTVDAVGNIYISDTGNNTIRKLTFCP